jgi:hypothetical protein
MSQWTFLGSQDQVDSYTFISYLDKLYLLHPRIGKDIDKD